MLAQTIQISFSSYAADTIRIHTGETGREIAFIPDMDISGEYSADFIVIKPDDTFAIAAATIMDGKINVEIPEQAGAVAGAGHYILKIYDSGEVCIYSASGGFMVDDHLLTDGIIESVAEVHGYVFPDDFMTDDDLVFNPTSTSSATVSKIKYKGITYGIESEAGDISKTVTGNPIELTDGANAPLVKCVTAITGSQDLHGYNKPWVGGAGKNKCSNDTTLHLNVTASIGSTGTFGINAFYDAYYLKTSDYANIAVSCDKTKLNSETIRVCYSNTIPASGTRYMRANNLVPGNYVTVNTTYTYIIFVFFWNNTSDKSLIQIENGTVCTDYSPYSNICPITAYTEGEIEVSDGDGNTTTHTTAFPSAIYRGSEDVVNGMATTEWGMIASYAGETLPGEWISDRDEYAPGTTPTTGAQVAYVLATPTTASVTPTNLPVKSLSGYNHIESSMGEMEVEYITEEYQPLVDLIQRGSEDDYSTQEKIVGKWIDGTPLYEQTIVSNSNPGQTFTLPCPTDAEIKEIKGMARVFLSNRFYYKEICTTSSAISWTDGKLDAEPKYGRINVYLNYPTGSAQVLAWVTIRYTKPLS